MPGIFEHGWRVLCTVCTVALLSVRAAGATRRQGVGHLEGPLRTSWLSGHRAPGVGAALRTSDDGEGACGLSARNLNLGGRCRGGRLALSAPAVVEGAARPGGHLPSTVRTAPGSSQMRRPAAEKLDHRAGRRRGAQGLVERVEFESKPPVSLVCRAVPGNRASARVTWNLGEAQVQFLGDESSPSRVDPWPTSVRAARRWPQPALSIAIVIRLLLARQVSLRKSESRSRRRAAATPDPPVPGGAAARRRCRSGGGRGDNAVQTETGGYHQGRTGKHPAEHTAARDETGNLRRGVRDGNLGVAASSDVSVVSNGRSGASTEPFRYRLIGSFASGKRLFKVI